jgi:3-hydroxyacyl-CoA dehydrogenase
MRAEVTHEGEDMAEVLRISREGEVAILEIDNPPVNATSQALRRALHDAVQRAQSEPETKAILICAAGRTFTAGGDITEFGKPPREPHLPDVINRIEESAKPVVVAWHGTALGGGCEIGLGAHKRIIAKDGLVGLPEVKLGLLRHPAPAPPHRPGGRTRSHRLGPDGRRRGSPAPRPCRCHRRN